MSDLAALPHRADWVITPHIGADAAHIQATEAFARRHGLRHAARGEQTLARIARAHDGAPVAAWHRDQGWIARTPEAEGGQVWRWHQGLAEIRAASADAGAPDRLVQALGGAGAQGASPLAGQRVLDANLGLGRDALVIAHAGAAEVVGLELDPVICALTQAGLARLAQAPGARLRQAAGRVRCAQACQRAWLSAAEAEPFDAVYFSPMFIDPRFEAPDVVGLRAVAADSWPTPDTIAAARALAPRVVIKVEHGRHPALPEPDAQLRRRRSRLTFLIYERRT